jgi:hypothetical protein
MISRERSSRCFWGFRKIRRGEPQTRLACRSANGTDRSVALRIPPSGKKTEKDVNSNLDSPQFSVVANCNKNSPDRLSGEFSYTRSGNLLFATRQNNRLFRCYSQCRDWELSCRFSAFKYLFQISLTTSRDLSNFSFIASF